MTFVQVREQVRTGTLGYTYLFDWVSQYLRHGISFQRPSAFRIVGC